MEFSPEAETEWSGLCDDEGAGAKAENRERRGGEQEVKGSGLCERRRAAAEAASRALPARKTLKSAGFAWRFE